MAHRCVAQFGRALRSGRRGRRFKSCHTDWRKAKKFLLYAFFISSCLPGEFLHPGILPEMNKGRQTFEYLIRLHNDNDPFYRPLPPERSHKT